MLVVVKIQNGNKQLFHILQRSHLCHQFRIAVFTAVYVDMVFTSHVNEITTFDLILFHFVSFCIPKYYHDTTMTENENSNCNNSSASYYATHIPRDVMIQLEAGVFNNLCVHLQERSDEVQNMDLMTLSGFCRNCLAKVRSGRLYFNMYKFPSWV